MAHDELPITTYEELLRAIGLLFDEEGLRGVRVWEHAGSLIVQGYRSGETNVRTIELAPDDLELLLAAARERRRRA